MTTSSSPSSSSSWRSSRSRAYSSCASTRSASAASRSSWRAAKVSEAVSVQPTRAFWRARRPLPRRPSSGHAVLDLVRLLVGGAVDPRDQRLGGAADRAEADAVVTRLAAVLAGLLADRVAAVERARGHGQGGLQRCPQHLAA